MGLPIIKGGYRHEVVYAKRQTFKGGSSGSCGHPEADPEVKQVRSVSRSAVQGAQKATEVALLSAGLQC